MDDLLSTHQIAAHLGVRPWTIRRWVSQGRIPHLKLGRLVKFSPHDISHWLAGQRVEARDPDARWHDNIARRLTAQSEGR